LEGITLASVNTIIGLYGIPPITQSQLDVLIPLALNEAENLTERRFDLVTNVTEFYHGNGKNSIVTLNSPITKIYHVIMYNQLLQAMRTFLDIELIVYPDRGEIGLPPIYPAFLSDAPKLAIFGNIFLPGYYNIEVNYDYGYTTATMPPQILLGVTQLVAARAVAGHAANVSKGLSSVSFDGYSESYGGNASYSQGGVTKTLSGPYSMVIAELRDIGVNMILKYKRLYFRRI
jgi:hypothetical protein